jgi:hypothetical protein
LKTKSFVDLLRKQTDAGKVLIVSDSFDDKTFKSARNVKAARLATAADVNTEQLLAFEKILVTQKALEKLAERASSLSPGASRSPSRSSAEAGPPLPEGEGKVRTRARNEKKSPARGARK